jgi:hypothetical protein
VAVGSVWASVQYLVAILKQAGAGIGTTACGCGLLVYSKVSLAATECTSAAKVTMNM